MPEHDTTPKGSLCELCVDCDSNKSGSPCDRCEAPDFEEYTPVDGPTFNEEQDDGGFD